MVLSFQLIGGKNASQIQNKQPLISAGAQTKGRQVNWFVSLILFILASASN
jgi:hypothetical protein